MILSTLQRIVESVNQAPEFDVALNTMVRSIKTALQTDVCSVYIANHERREFILMASDGLVLPEQKRVRLKFGEGLVSLAAEREEPLNIADARQHPNFKSIRGIAEEAYRAMLVAPIIHQRQVLGVLVVQQRSARAFSSDEESFLVTLAAQLAAVVAQAEMKGIIPEQETPWIKSLQAIPGVPGIAFGRAFIGQPIARLDAVVPRRTEQPWREIHKFRKAVLQTRQDLQALAEQVAAYVAQDTLAIFDMYQGMLDAASLGTAVEEKIKEGWQAQTAVKLVVDDFIRQFENLDDSYLRERAVDVRDLGQRVLGHLQHIEKVAIQVPEATILVAEEVTASMLASIPRQRLQGVVSLRGSPNSHAAIMARSMGVPAVFSVSDVPLSYLEEQFLVVDGYSGEIFINPPPELLKTYQDLHLAELELTQVVRNQQGLAANTLDGIKVDLHVNVGFNLEQYEQGQVQGVGLYRTEIPFMLRERFPTEMEQYQLYLGVLRQYQGQPVVMRTLDVGGDKPLPYFPIQEANPFLGWRGLRMTLDHPEIFLVQIRAMLRANAEFGTLKIMLPMVTSIAEVDEAKRLIEQAYAEVNAELNEELQKKHSQEKGQSKNMTEAAPFILPRPQLGVMLEVPALLYQLEHLATRVDFCSVGTNDLTQYLLAVDRNNPRVADLYQAYHPALLQVLQDVAQRCQQLKLPVSVCGELAGEPAGALLLLAMGYRNLSMNSYSLDKIRWLVRHIQVAKLADLREQVMQEQNAEGVKKRLREKLERLGLGRLIRVGK